MKWKLTEFGKKWENTELLQFLEKHSDPVKGIARNMWGLTFIVQGSGVGAFYAQNETEIKWTKTWNLTDFDPLVAVMEPEPGEPMQDQLGQVDMKLVVTHSWNKEKSHTPYRWSLRTPDNDMEMDRYDLLSSMIKHAGADDGDEIEIIVRKTGRRPFGDRKVVWVRPHEYEREP